MIYHQFSSVSQSCLTPCNPMNCSTSGLSVHHNLPEFAQTHVYRVSDAIQPSHPLSVPFSSCLQFFPASWSFLMSPFFASGGQSIGASASASVLPVNMQDWFPLGLTGLIFLQSKRLSRIFANTTVEKHQSFGAQPSLWSIVLSGRDKMMGKKSMQNPFIDEVFIVPKRYIIKEIKWPYSIVFIVIRKISRVVG